MSRGEKRAPADVTFETVRARYQDWKENHTPAPYRGSTRAYQAPAAGGGDMVRAAGVVIGAIIGVILLALAAYAFYTAAWWSGYNRDAGVVGYTVIGIFLTVAGLGGLIAIWNHQTRVLDPGR
jgi:hypothetical protein